jgi:hypothetical protein
MSKSCQGSPLPGNKRRLGVVLQRQYVKSADGADTDQRCGPGLADQVYRLQNPRFLRLFNGPGVTTMEEGVYARGTIIDWKSGVVSPPPTVAKRFEIAVFTTARARPRCLTDEPCPIYVVSYDYDPVSKQG